jgi:hypothetical protein
MPPFHGRKVARKLHISICLFFFCSFLIWTTISDHKTWENLFSFIFATSHFKNPKMHSLRLFSFLFFSYLGKMVKLKLKPGWELKVKSVTSVSQFLIKFQDIITIGVNMLTTKLIYSLSHKIICWQHTLCIPCITKRLCLQHTWCISYVAKTNSSNWRDLQKWKIFVLGSLTFLKSLKFKVRFY